MQKNIQVISANCNALDLVAIFEGAGHHHLPVTNKHHELVGVITQADFVRAIRTGSAPLNNFPRFISGFFAVVKPPLMLTAGF
jgi:CBS-domain-containing membrane protein